MTGNESNQLPMEGKTIAPPESKSAAKSRKALAAARRAAKEAKKKGTRPYPKVPLEKSIQVAKSIKENNGGNPWSGEMVAKAIGKSPKGVDFTYYLLSSKKFGLTDGANPKGQVALTALGKEVVYSGSAQEELDAKRRAFLNVPIFRDVLTFYKGSSLPEMQYLGNTLQSRF